MVKEAHKPTYSWIGKKWPPWKVWATIALVQVIQYWYALFSFCYALFAIVPQVFYIAVSQYTLFLSLLYHASPCYGEEQIKNKSLKDWKSWTWSLDCFPIHRSSPSPITWIWCGDFEQMLGSSKNHTTILCFLTGRRIWSLSPSTWLVKRSPALWPRLGFTHPSQRGRWSLHWSVGSCEYWGDVPSCSVLLGSLPVRVASLLRSWKEWSALEWVARLYVDTAWGALTWVEDAHPPPLCCSLWPLSEESSSVASK